MTASTTTERCDVCGATNPLCTTPEEARGARGLGESTCHLLTRMSALEAGTPNETLVLSDSERNLATGDGVPGAGTVHRGGRLLRIVSTSIFRRDRC